MLNDGDIILYFIYLLFYILYNYFSRVESNKFDIYSKIGNIFIGSNFQKIKLSLNYQISLMKTTQVKFSIITSKEKYKKVKWLNMKYFCGKLSFLCTCISHIGNLLCNVFLDKYGLSSNNFHTLLSALNRLQKRKYSPNT